jgi:hypothetical protein
LNFATKGARKAAPSAAVPRNSLRSNMNIASVTEVWATVHVRRETRMCGLLGVARHQAALT